MVTILVLIPSKQGFTAKRHIKQVPTGTESHAKVLFWRKRFLEDILNATRSSETRHWQEVRNVLRVPNENEAAAVNVFAFKKIVNIRDYNSPMKELCLSKEKLDPS